MQTSRKVVVFPKPFSSFDCKSTKKEMQPSCNITFPRFLSCQNSLKLQFILTNINHSSLSRQICLGPLSFFAAQEKFSPCPRRKNYLGWERHFLALPIFLYIDFNLTESKRYYAIIAVCMTYKKGMPPEREHPHGLELSCFYLHKTLPAKLFVSNK